MRLINVRAFGATVAGMNLARNSAGRRKSRVVIDLSWTSSLNAATFRRSSGDRNLLVNGSTPSSLTALLPRGDSILGVVMVISYFRDFVKWRIIFRLPDA
jgi:hypothetical protein